MVEIHFNQFVILGEMNEKHLFVDESSPIAHTFEAEACLDGSHLDVVQVLFQFVSVEGKSFEQVVCRFVSQDGIFRIGIQDFLVIPLAELFLKVDHTDREIVCIERGVEIRVERVEVVQMIGRVGLPFRITEQVQAVFIGCLFGFP